MGWGYFPNNLPQWNYRYKVAFALLDKTGKVAQIQVDGQCEPSVWVNAKVFDYKTDVTVNVPAGEYTWAVAIVNTDDGDKPAIQLATRGEITAEGWLKITKVNVK